MTESKSNDPRLIQATTLWDRGFGGGSRGGSLEAYLKGIPEIPESLLPEDLDLFLLSLADPRVGLVTACSLTSIRHRKFGNGESDVVPFDDRYIDSREPFWFRHDYGKRNLHRRPDLCLAECQGQILAGTAIVGVFAYVHHPQFIKGKCHYIDLPGSVHRRKRCLCAGLGEWGGQVDLYVDREVTHAGPNFGSLRFRRQ